MKWIKTHLSKALIGYLLLGVGIGVATVEVKGRVSDTQQSAHKSCVVQDRGLKANKYQLSMWEHIRNLEHPGATEKIRKETEAQEPKRTKEEIKAFERDLKKYLELQRQQPTGRKC